MSLSRRHAGRVALVTGASKGIGRATAVRLGAEGASVAVAYRSGEQEAKEVVKEIRDLGSNATALFGDLSDALTPAALVEAASRRLGDIDILVNNAAIFPWTAWDEVSTDEWDTVFAINVRAAFLLSRAVAPAMKKNGWGRIVSLSSATFLTGSEHLMHYSASKAALVGLTRSLARALGDFGITANAVTTGRTLTDGVQKWMDDGVMSMEEAVNSRASQCVKRLGVPDDIVGTISFLASDDAAYMTGQLLNVDGGRNMQ